jgi:hypothetical protein
MDYVFCQLRSLRMSVNDAATQTEALIMLLEHQMFSLICIFISGLYINPINAWIFNIHKISDLEVPRGDTFGKHVQLFGAPVTFVKL